MTKDWDGHRDTILKLYKEQNQPLKDVMRVMEEQYKFKVSVRAYRSRLKRWGVYKYNVGRRNSLLTEKTSVSDDAAYSCHRNSSQSPDSRPAMDSPHLGTTHHEFFANKMFGAEESVTGAIKTESGTPPSPLSPLSPLPFCGRPTLPTNRMPLCLPPIDVREHRESFTLPRFGTAQRHHHHAGFGGHSPEAPVFSWTTQDMSVFHPHGS